MTALAGVWNFDGKPAARDSCARMLSAQNIYGPHETNQWDAGAIALGRSLFRTLPEDVFDNQPLIGGGGRYRLVADVRLDNRDDLIAALGIAADRARDLCDTAILLAAWERWQDDCFDHLVGDYAFVLWDAAENRLVLARDPLGQRPLHFHRGQRFFAFASMPKGLHTLPEVPRQPDEQRLSEFLALLPEGGSASFFAGVERVEAAHIVTVTPNGVVARRHWNPKYKPILLGSPDDYAEALRAHLDTAVRVRLRGAGAAVGAHLSAGLDSASVVASAARQLAPSGGRVVAYTSVPRDGYDGPSPKHRLGDEGPIAAKTAALYPNVEHVLVRNNRGSPFEGLDRGFFLYDRPILNACNMVWLDAINEAARARRLSVVLTGAMGNMSISYNGLTLLPHLIQTGRLGQWARTARALKKRGVLSWKGVLAQSFGPYMPGPMWLWINKRFGDQNFDVKDYSAIRSDRLEALGIDAIARERGLDLSYRPRTNGFDARIWVLGRVDLGNVNKGILGGWGIDLRDPTADRRLLEFALNVPEEQNLRNGVTRALARRAFADRLPREVVEGGQRGYQSADWHEGLTAARAEAATEIARLGNCGPAEAAIDLPRLGRLLENMPQSGWETNEVMVHYRLALLRGIAAGHFIRKASGSNA